jgi:Major Facilitator Superfamily
VPPRGRTCPRIARFPGRRAVARELCDRRRCGGATDAYHAAVLKPRLALTHGGGLSEETCRRLTLAATVLGSSMAYVTAINVAVPAIGADLDIDLGGQQWVILSYSLALASLYLVAGALGDRLGRRKMFMIGTTAFAAASALGGVAPERGRPHRCPRPPGGGRRPAHDWKPLPPARHVR